MFYDDGRVQIHNGDALEVLAGLPAESIDCCVTSPPYWGLRDYGTARWEGGDSACDHIGRSQTSQASTLGDWKNGGGQRYKENAGGMPYRDICGKCGARRVDQQIGLEPTPGEYVDKLVAVFREVKRVLRGNGTLWLNLGDSYAQGGRGGVGNRSTLEGSRHSQNESRQAIGVMGEITGPGLKAKDLVGIPWRVAFALQADGWYLRQDIIWSKPGPMPESVQDRCTKSHDYIFLLAKSKKYYYDAEAVKELATGSAHPRGNGVNPKALISDYAPNQAASNQERLHRRSPPVSGWNSDRGSHTAIGHNAESKDERYERSRIKQNGSFSSAVAELVETRNLRSVWTIASEPLADAHFAPFPSEIPRRCILAGTSERGNCPACGRPWKRIVEKSRTYESASGRLGHKCQGKVRADGQDRGPVQDDIRSGPCIHSMTIGWRPTCKCGLDTTVPAVVLDPFAGSGRTGKVAKYLGRKAILIDLSAKYCEMARRQVESADVPMPLNNERTERTNATCDESRT